MCLHLWQPSSAQLCYHSNIAQLIHIGPEQSVTVKRVRCLRRIFFKFTVKLNISLELQIKKVLSSFVQVLLTRTHRFFLR